MQRPPSIVRYEQLYLGSFILGLVVSAVSWQGRAAQLSANPALGNLQWVMPVALVVGIVISITLWYFTARNPSIAAKWVVTVFAALSLLGIARNLYALVGGTVPLLSTLFAILVSVLYVAAAVMLFKPDAKLWFGEEPADGDIA